LALTLDVTVDDLLFVEGRNESPEEIKIRIGQWLETLDAKKLREYYRLLLVVAES
jgi:hypothetical protein